MLVITKELHPTILSLYTEYNSRSVAFSPAGVAPLGVFLDDTSAEEEDL